jgi:hypothetical protein
LEQTRESLALPDLPSAGFNHYRDSVVGFAPTQTWGWQTA